MNHKPFLVGIGHLDLATLLLLALAGDLMAKHDITIVDHHEYADGTIPIIYADNGNIYMDHKAAFDRQYLERIAAIEAERHNRMVDNIARIMDMPVTYVPPEKHNKAVLTRQQNPIRNQRPQQRHHKPIVRRDIPRR